MVELARETARARRTHRPFVLAFVDVDGLKTTNDSLGHAAGDELLVRVVNTMRAHLRPYDLITRVGGDEFLCSLLDLTTAQAAERFLLINADLAKSPHTSITAGIAELAADESLDHLIARADAALRTQPSQRPTVQARERSETHDAEGASVSCRRHRGRVDPTGRVVGIFSAPSTPIRMDSPGPQLKFRTDDPSPSLDGPEGQPCPEAGDASGTGDR